jgi:hypothetical protein
MSPGCQGSYKFHSSLPRRWGRVTVGVSTPRGGPWTDEWIVAACLCPDGLARDGTQDVGQALYYPAPGVPLEVGVTSASREGGGGEREWARTPLPLARTPNLFQGGPGLPFYRGKERVQVYNGGRSYALTCPTVECLSPVYMPTWPSGESLGAVHVMAWPPEERLSPVGAQLAARWGPCWHLLAVVRGWEPPASWRTRGTIITRRRGKLDGTPVLFLVAWAG